MAVTEDRLDHIVEGFIARLCDEIDVDDPRVVLERTRLTFLVEDLARPRNTRTVDADVDATEAFERNGHERVAVAALRDVGSLHQGLGGPTP